MGYVVCLDVGEFDEVFSGPSSKHAAKQYKKHLRPLCKYKLKIKPAEQVRKIREEFENEEICTGITVPLKKV